jgi:rhodanese-related sulfurtransferase
MPRQDNNPSSPNLAPKSDARRQGISRPRSGLILAVSTIPFASDIVETGLASNRIVRRQLVLTPFPVPSFSVPPQLDKESFFAPLLPAMTTPTTPLPYEIDVQAVKELLDSEHSFVFVDCREPDEYEFCRIEGTRLLPIKQVGEWLPAFEAHKGEHIVIHCHAGRRSLRLTEMLRQHGFNQVQSMKGGINAWSNEIDPRIPIY